MKKLSFLFVALVGFSGLAACGGKMTLVAKDADGNVTDRLTVLASAPTLVSPSLAIPVKVVHGKIVPFGDIQSTASILQQLSPIAAAGALRPAVNNNTNNNNTSSEANSASMSWSEVKLHLSQTQINQYNSCQPVMYGGQTFAKRNCD